MNRNSSFFWASDALRDVEVEEDDDEEENVGLSWEDHDEPFTQNTEINIVPLEVATIPNKETQPLINTNNVPSYGISSLQSANISSQRQDHRFHIFPHSSRSPPAQKESKLSILRFQVVIWHIGKVDVCQGHVNMRFRITLFWNAIKKKRVRTSMGSDSSRLHPNNSTVWVMKSRQLACKMDFVDEHVAETIDVPPISILNAVSFDAMGDAEVTMVDSEARLMRWTCMYTATLFQGDHMRVDQFPHDSHNLTLKIGILAERGRHQLWDKSIYKLGLATEVDSQGSTKIPYGLVVDHVTIPDFTFNPRDLHFALTPLDFGTTRNLYEQDIYLKVTLPVFRLATLYDRSIMPILALLNIVAISCIPRNFDSATASTETMLSIAFVQVGIRLTIDSRLPSVGYQIKMQKVLNQCFWLLCGLVLESNIVFFLVIKRGWRTVDTDPFDAVTALIAFVYTAYILAMYYGGRLNHSTKPPFD